MHATSIHTTQSRHSHTNGRTSSRTHIRTFSAHPLGRDVVRRIVRILSIAYYTHAENSNGNASKFARLCRFPFIHALMLQLAAARPSAHLRCCSAARFYCVFNKRINYLSRSGDDRNDVVVVVVVILTYFQFHCKLVNGAARALVVHSRVPQTNKPVQVTSDISLSECISHNCCRCRSHVCYFIIIR